MNLLELQRRMAEDVMRPLTADFEMQPAANDGSSTTAIADSYVKPNERLSSFERLEIYNRQYWFRVIESVAEDFPTLNAVLGDKKHSIGLSLHICERIHRHPSRFAISAPNFRNGSKITPSSLPVVTICCWMWRGSSGPTSRLMTEPMCRRSPPPSSAILGLIRHCLCSRIYSFWSFSIRWTNLF